MAQEHKAHAAPTPSQHPLTSPLISPPILQVKPQPTPQNPAFKVVDPQAGLSYISRNLLLSFTAQNTQLLQAVQYLKLPLRNAVACIKNNLMLTVSAYIQELTKRLELLNNTGTEVKADNDGTEESVTQKAEQSAQPTERHFTPEQIVEATYLINLEKIAGKQLLFESSVGKTLLACIFFIDPHITSPDVLEKLLRNKAFSKDIATLKAYGLLEVTPTGTLFVNPLLKTLIIHRELVPEDLHERKKAWVDFLLETAERRDPHSQSPQKTNSQNNPQSLEIRLIQAAKNGQLEVVRLLLATGVDIRAGQKQAGTPLALAAEHGQYAVMDFLLSLDKASARPQMPTLIPYTLDHKHRHLAIAGSFLTACSENDFWQWKTHLKPLHEELLSPCPSEASPDQKAFALAYFQRVARHQFLTSPLPQVLIEIIRSFLLPYDIKEYPAHARHRAAIITAPADAFSLAPFLGRTPYIDLLLMYVAHNTVPAVKAIFNKDPTLAFESGKVHVPGAQCFFDVTPLSCALYLQHWEMASAILSALPLDEAKKQLKAHEQHGAHPYGQDKEKTPPLISAMKKKQPAMVLQLLQCGASPNVQEEKSGGSAFSIAVQHPDIKMVKSFLETKADTEIRDAKGSTPLMRAAGDGRLSVMRLLLDAGANKDAKDSKGSTPLLWAVWNGQLKAARMLLAEGVEDEDISLTSLLKRDCLKGAQCFLDLGRDIETKDRAGDTPFLWAIKNGRLQEAKWLLKAGANKEARDQLGDTPLMWAAQNGRSQEVQFLLDARADREAKDEGGNTPLVLAVVKHQLGTAQLLMAAGANKKAKHRDGCGLLSWAAAEGYLEAVQLFLDADENENIEAPNQYGSTPLILAAARGHVEVVRLLLKRGANIEARGARNRTALEWAEQNGHPDCVALIREQLAEPLLTAVLDGEVELTERILGLGADKETQDSYGNTPLALAALKGRVEILQLLLGVDADTEAKNQAGNTPLALAAAEGYLEIVQLLLDADADRESKNKSGDTPLICAAKNGHTKVVKLLLELGVNIDARGEKNRTALEWAEKNQRYDGCVCLLREHAAKLARAAAAQAKPSDVPSRNRAPVASYPDQPLGGGSRFLPAPKPTAAVTVVPVPVPAATVSAQLDWM